MPTATRAMAGKRLIRGLSKLVSARREALGDSLQVFATKASISIPRLRDAEVFSLATDETLRLLAGVGVDVQSLKSN